MKINKYNKHQTCAAIVNECWQ